MYNPLLFPSVFAWEAYEHGNDIHPLADPTKLEIMHKEFKVKKDDFQTDQKQSVLERYGGEEHLDTPPKELLLAQTEEYVEYSRSGNVVKGQERAVAKSRYEEDVFTNNHTVSVLGGREGEGVGGKRKGGWEGREREGGREIGWEGGERVGGREEGGRERGWGGGRGGGKE